MNRSHTGDLACQAAKGAVFPSSARHACRFAVSFFKCSPQCSPWYIWYCNVYCLYIRKWFLHVTSRKFLQNALTENPPSSTLCVSHSGKQEASGKRGGVQAFRRLTLQLAHALGYSWRQTGRTDRQTDRLALLSHGDLTQPLLVVGSSCTGDHKAVLLLLP